MTRVNNSGKRIPIFTPLNENANDLVRGYFMRDSEGGYAPFRLIYKELYIKHPAAKQVHVKTSIFWT